MKKNPLDKKDSSEPRQLSILLEDQLENFKYLFLLIILLFKNSFHFNSSRAIMRF